MIDFASAHRFLRAEFDREAAAGFTRLDRVPDTHVRQFLDYYRSLDTEEQSALAHASTLWGAHTLAGSTIGEGAVDRGDVASALQSNAAWASWRNDMVYGKQRDRYWYASVPELRLHRAMATMREKAGEPLPSEWDKMMAEYARSVVGAKAPALRKLVRALVESRFRGRATKGGGGDWMYEGDVNGGRLLLSIDWGGKYAQLRYGFSVEARTGTIRLARGFEAALGAGHGDWDFLTEENAAASIALLGDLIEHVAQWPDRLANESR